MKGLAGVFGDRPNACGVETYKFLEALSYFYVDRGERSELIRPSDFCTLSILNGSIDKGLIFHIPDPE